MFSFKRTLIALVGVLVLVGALAALLPLVSRGQGGNPLTRDPRRSYYLTQTTHNRSQALSACGSGYHMASLWKILDPSNVKYDTQLAITNGGSGLGPPSVLRGWVRTGFSSSEPGTFEPGRAKCAAWTIGDNSQAGTFVSLNQEWDGGSFTNVNQFIPNVAGCQSLAQVWCVQD
jgi:hypothetical protein